MKLLLLISLFIVTLFSRENPFFPIEGESDLSSSSNVVEYFEPLKIQKIRLPNSARVLKKITFTYKNLDGSIATKELKLENSIDWHYPLLVTQKLKSPQKITKKTHKKQITKRVKRKRFVQVFKYKFISFYQKDRFIQLKVKDSLLRKFMVVNPHRIVLDFKRDAIFLSKEKILPSKFYKKIRLGNHDGYYRVVLELDGKYRYRVAKKSFGYLVEVY